mmetsp:Transcript_7035/g.13046  ORF Transcript_7035/g.13046 Transcript_7035/m.13046 type:complete len:249 (+) Transcript_7035:87-833(+)
MLSQISSTQQASGLDQARPEEKNCSMPVTIRMIEAAVQQSNGILQERLSFHGFEQHLLILVAVIEVVVKQPAIVEFCLNDATGRIRAKYYVTEKPPKVLEELAAGSYVSVFGTVRTAPSLHFAVAGMHKVTSADTVSYHMVESAHAILKLKKLRSQPPKVTAAPLVAQAITPATPKLQPMAVRLEGEALRNAVLAALRGGSGPEGVALETIVNATRPTPRSAVCQVLEQLQEEGDIFTTIDDTHFQCV